MTSIEEKRRARTAFLNALYDAADGSPDFYEAWGTIGARVGLGPEESDAAAQYLVREGLVEFPSRVGRNHALGGPRGKNHVPHPNEASDRLARNFIFGDVHNSRMPSGCGQNSQVPGGYEFRRGGPSS